MKIVFTTTIAKLILSAATTKAAGDQDASSPIILDQVMLGRGDVFPSVLVDGTDESYGDTFPTSYLRSTSCIPGYCYANDDYSCYK